ncbi:MAG TPA: PD-(D/E)XK nuclease family protein [Gaiellaceae bacterium]
MPLALLVGPANAGKVARLLDSYLANLDREPFLVVPNRGDVERVERELLARSGGLLGGQIGTFDDLFDRILFAAGAEVQAERRPPLGPVQRGLLLERVVSGASLNGLGRSARFPGFADALAEAISDLEAALIDPGAIAGGLSSLYAAYRGELERIGRSDRELDRALAARLVASELEAWDGTPVLAYGFEDLTGAQWTLLEALAGRADVTVSLPYEPGRAAFASLERTASDLAALADGRVEELPAQPWYDAPALAHLERTIFTESDAEPPPLDGAVRFLEAAGPRAVLELVGEEVLSLLRDGVAAEEIAVVCPSVERVRAPLDTVFGELGIPYAIEGTLPLGRSPLGRALLGLVRFAWLDGGRRELFAFLRSPYSGLARSRADFVEGRLRGRAVSDRVRVEEETLKLLGHGIPALAEARGGGDLPELVRTVTRTMLRAAYGLERPPVGEASRLDLRAREAAERLAAELEGWQSLGGRLGPETVVAALDRAPVRLQGTRDPGHVAVLDLLRARTRRFQAMFVLGLEEGTLPRRATETPFLSDEERASLEASGRNRRLVRPDPVARDRYLFYTACTRPWMRLTLAREAASDEGRPREPSPFWDEVRSRFDADEVARFTRRRPLSALAWDLDRAPTERERLRATAALASSDADEAHALAEANGWERRLQRALAAFARPTKLTHPQVLEELRERMRFSATELETFGDCSSLWLVDRVIDPRTIDAEVDARLRGSVAHQALYRFFSGLPKRLGVDQVGADQLDDALVFLRECLAEAVAGQVRIDLSDVERLELEGALARDLEQFVRQELELAFPLAPRRFEVAFGSSTAPVELQRGLDLGGFTLSGKIDRIDVDPFSARGIVQDYKSGKTSHSAAQIESEGRLQVPLYVLALRDLVGIEPIGGLYRALAGSREARGLVLSEAKSDVPGLKRADYLADEEFWQTVEGATERARAAVARIRAGDVEHDPRKGDCPTWCDRWPMCRVRRA